MKYVTLDLGLGLLYDACQVVVGLYTAVCAARFSSMQVLGCGYMLV
ncbi:MAG: hypothetical protein KA362_10985 [Chloroflexi bacterium]|nr:hypothetical protein [Chloroflexota bacterium]MBK7178612.1 hypothetical protein [Chloroflexota bacterium]MBK8935566.1 hypothetical protein [Chloroflexota bacterium]MBP6804624.1 hypothetical protein [Chloroflexota bacterium]MBP7591666.1 hypothetical protein [Chloroflexota bacterium]